MKKEYRQWSRNHLLSKTSTNLPDRKTITKIVTEKYFCIFSLGVSVSYNELEYLGYNQNMYIYVVV